MSTTENVTVQCTAFLVIAAEKTARYPHFWRARVVRVGLKKPALASNEVAIEVTIALPVALFEKPTLSAKIAVDGDAPRLELSDETVANLQDVIRSTIGLGVELTVVKQ